MRELLWPAFRDGDLSLNPQTFVHNSVDVEHLRGGGDPHAAWNLGELAGLRGLSSLLPLVVVWVIARRPAAAVRDRAASGRTARSSSATPRRTCASSKRRAPLASGADALEIGTGTGGMLHALLERGLRARGVEINPALIAESRQWFGESAGAAGVRACSCRSRTRRSIWS